MRMVGPKKKYSVSDFIKTFISISVLGIIVILVYTMDFFIKLGKLSKKECKYGR